MLHKIKTFSFLVVAFFVICQLSGQASEETQGLILGGSLNSPIKIEVFSDFQCPACKDLYLQTLRQILQEYSSKDKVCIIYHEYPLAIHKYSREAARYAEAAARIGTPKLLQVMDSMFTEQLQWSQDGKLEEAVAKALSRDEFEKIKKIMQDPAISLAIDKEVQLGDKKGITSTPTMFIYYLGKEQKVDFAKGMLTPFVLKQFIDQIVK